MNGEFHDVGLFLAVSFAVVLILAACYRIAVYRARSRLHGRSTRDRERNMPTILRFHSWLGQVLRSSRKRRRSRSRRDR